jgi:hypothetical protein
MGRLERNSAAIRRYLTEVLPKLEKSTVAPEEPPDRKHRGGSRSPWGRGGDEIVEANRAASRIITPLVREAVTLSRALQEGCPRLGKMFGGVAFHEVLLAAWQHPGIVRSWKARETKEDRAHDDALWQMCVLMARSAQAEWDSREITNLKGEVLKEATQELEIADLLDVPQEDEQLEASQWQLAHNRDVNEKKSLEAQDSYRSLNAEMDEIRAQGAPNDKEAIKVLRARRKARKDPDVSPATVYRARAFCRGEVEMAEQGRVYRLKDGDGDDGEAA